MIYRVGRTRFKLGMASRPEREALKRVRHEEMAPRSGSQPNLGAGILAREVTGLRAADVRIGDGQRILKDAHCHRLLLSLLLGLRRGDTAEQSTIHALPATHIS